MRKNIIKKEDVDAIIRLYKQGFSQRSIAEQVSVSSYVVKSVIKNNLGQYTEVSVDHMKKEDHSAYEKYKERKQLMIDMYKKGYTLPEIAEKTGLITTYIESVLTGAGLIKYVNIYESNGAITLNTLAKFRDNEVKLGNRYVIRKEEVDDFGNIIKTRIEVKVLEKYPYIVCTDKGCFQYFDLYINRNNK